MWKIAGWGMGAVLWSLGAAGWAATGDAPVGVQDLKFRDFFASPIGPRGLEMSATLKAAHGQRVRLTGYMVAQEDGSVGEFFLTPLPIRMSEHADGDADDLPPSTVVVVMPAPDSARPLPHTAGLLQLTGVLQVGRHELPGGRVVWLRLLLDPRDSAVAGVR